MADNVISARPGFVFGYEAINVNSHFTNIIRLPSFFLYILEFEDALFHLDSAVMLPENPEGKSSTQGGGASADQEQISGVQMLALFFRQLEFDSGKTFVVTGHTDTSGEPDLNFKLSDLRARNVLYLLTNQKDEWCEISAERHKTEDYQQIMKFFSKRNGWPCDPGDLDDKWGSNTENATSAFLDNTTPATAASILEQIRSDPKKKWTKEAWACVYDLYMDILDKTLEESAGKRLKRQIEAKSRYADSTKPFTACGESFPIDNKQKDNYRSQKNRRVEIILFYPGEAPKLTCPAITDRTHKPQECPLWHKFYFIPRYIDVKDLYAVMYHIQFFYFDRVKKDVICLPQGLIIYAFEDGAKQIQSSTAYSNGTYFVKVQFNGAIRKPDRKKFYFEFTGSDMWIYTKDSLSEPQLIKKPTAEIDALPIDKQWNYQPLPKRWSSLEFWTRYEGSSGGSITISDIKDGTDKGAFYKDIFIPSSLKPSPLLTQDYKPFGDKTTTSDKPLVFCLDDCILTGSTFVPLNKTSNFGGQRLPCESTFFDNTLEIINPDKGNKKEYFTIGGLKDTYIPFRLHNGKRLQLITCNTFVFCLSNDHVDNNDYAGQRAMVFNHKKDTLFVQGFQQKHYRHSIGNTDTYLFRNIDFADNKFISAILVHARWHFYKEETGPAGAKIQKPYDQDWINTACKNVSDIWNDRKNNQLVALEGSDGTISHKISIKYHLVNVDKNAAATLVNVLPAGTIGRSGMSKNSGTWRADQNEMDKKSGGFVGAHEFGHITSIDDNYHERWDNCCYEQRGFVDFKPGAPFDYDRNAIMRSNIEIRSRDYWHYSEWMYKEFLKGKNITFRIIKKDETDYSLPYNSLNNSDPRKDTIDAISFYNYPEKSAKLYQNDKSNKGRFAYYLYPLGKDKFSSTLLLPKLESTGLLILPVNMRFQFWEGADYENIRDTLDAIKESIYVNILKKMKIMIRANGHYKVTCIKIQPRYLINNYNKTCKEDTTTKAQYDKKVNGILGKSDIETHFSINVIDPVFGTIFTNSKWQNATTLELVNSDRHDFWKFFCEMIGLEHKELPTKDNFDVSLLVPGGKMDSL